MPKLSHPKIDDDTLKVLMRHMQPVVRGDDGELWTIAPVDPRTAAFTWSPKLVERAPALELITTIPTLHVWGFYGFFKPSIAEVMACIPHHLVDRVCAFETHGPDTADDLNASKWVTMECGMHLAATHLYQRKTS